MTDTSHTISVRDRLEAAKKERSGNATTTLPQSGLVVTYPKFIPHGRWARAQRLAKGDNGKAQLIMLADICVFDGEKLTLADFELFSAFDVMHLMGETFGDEDEKDDDEGNVRVN